MSPLLQVAAGPRTPRTIVAHVEDRPGVLARVVTLFRRRGYNIVSLTVARTHEAGVSRLTAVVDADDDTARRLEANLYKLIDVIAVDDLTSAPAVIHELAMVKVNAAPRERTDVIELGKVFGARVVDVGPTTLTIQITATRDAVDRLIAALEPHGIVDLVRTGAVAMPRGDVAPVPKADAYTLNEPDLDPDLDD
jgi:acetolactate synthase-1/3 small subunit